MNRRQKSTILNLLSVIILTAVLVSAVGYWKNHVNKSDSIRVMRLLSKVVRQYRQQNHKALPPESYINRQREAIGDARLGRIQYRARWIDFNAGMDTILAYAHKDYGMAAGKGYIVMRLDYNVEWMGEMEFEELFAAQRNQAEPELSK